jgi:PAXNEB protein
VITPTTDPSINLKLYLDEIILILINIISSSSNSSHTTNQTKRFSQSAHTTNTIHKIYIPQLFNVIHFCNPCNDRDLNSDLLLVLKAVLAIKQLTRESKSTLILSISPDVFPASFLSLLNDVADTSFSVLSFAGVSYKVPYEFQEYCGFFVVKKLQEVNSIAPFRPNQSKFGLKRDHRKLHILPLHLPPEDPQIDTYATAASNSVSDGRKPPSATMRSSLLAVSSTSTCLSSGSFSRLDF